MPQIIKSGHNIVFDEETHTYSVNGRPMPSVTTVLEDVLNSMAGIPAHLVKAAGDFGTHVHQACELYDLGDLDEEALDPNLAPYLNGYKAFLRDYKPQWHFIESKVAHDILGFAGTLDRAGIIKDVLWQVDVKSSAIIPKTVGAQTFAYNEGLKDTYGIKVDPTRACLLLKPNDYQFVPLKDNTTDRSLFISCLTVWKYKHKNSL